MSTAYIVPNDFLAANPPQGCKEWHATGFPADLTQSLLVVEWDNPNAQAAYEAVAEVLPLGAPWEPLSTEAAPLMESLSDPVQAARVVTAPIDVTAPVQPETVKTALQKIAWPGVRSIR